MRVSLRREPVEWAYRLVIIETRAGTQRACGVTAWRYMTPSSAIRSRDGVGMPISEYIWSAVAFSWSATMKMTLGKELSVLAFCVIGDCPISASPAQMRVQNVSHGIAN